MKKSLFVFIVIFLINACRKNVVEEFREILPANIDNTHIIHEEEAVRHVNSFMNAVTEDSVPTKGIVIFSETKVKTFYRSIRFVNETNSGTWCKDSVLVPIYLIESENNQTKEKRTVMYVGDNRVSNPFVAFSDNGMFDLSEIPAFEEYFNYNLDSYIQTEILISLLTKARGGIPPEQNGYSCQAVSTYKIEVDINSAGPLITNISWNQSNPENDSLYYCPSHGARIPSGCVAIAVAQILSYHGYPTSGSYSSYLTPGLTVSTSYDWNIMTSVVDGELTANATIRSMIANLMAKLWGELTTSYHIGPATVVCFSSSDDYAARAVLQGYGYTNANIINNNSSFLPTIRNEIDNNRPVYMAGMAPTSAGGGHAWVVDGYKDVCIEKGILYYCFLPGNNSSNPDLIWYEPEDLGATSSYYRFKLGAGPLLDIYLLNAVAVFTHPSSGNGYDFSFYNTAIINIF